MIYLICTLEKNYGLVEIFFLLVISVENIGMPICTEVFRGKNTEFQSSHGKRLSRLRRYKNGGNGIQSERGSNSYCQR